MSQPKNKVKNKKSVKPKIKREHEKSTDEMNDNLEVSASPIFESKFKSTSTKKSRSDVKSPQYTVTETEKEWTMPHEVSCGCHTFFIEECKKDIKKNSPKIYSEISYKTSFQIGKSKIIEI